MNQTSINRPLQLRDVQDCTSCGAKKGVACRRPSCPQIKPLGGEMRLLLPTLKQVESIAAGTDPIHYARHNYFRDHKLNDVWTLLYPSNWNRAATPEHLILVDVPSGRRFQVDMPLK